MGAFAVGETVTAAKLNNYTTPLNNILVQNYNTTQRTIDATASYQNTTAYPMFINAVFNYQLTATSAGYAVTQVGWGSTSSATTNTVALQFTAPMGVTYVPTNIVVPPLWYYKAMATTNGINANRPNLVSWYETTFNT